MKKLLSLMIMFIASLSLIYPVSALTCNDIKIGEKGKCVSSSILGEDYYYDKDGNPVDPNANNAVGKVHCVCDDGQGSSIEHILNLVIDIMTIGVGILGVVGISISGIQYLTAAGNEEKTRKAKRRLLEIVIGLAVYALFYAILTWLGINRT